MSGLRVFDDALLDRLSSEARESPRLRAHHLIHRDHSDLHQRLLIALEPGTYVRPHRHLDPPRDETFVLLRGQVRVLTFDDAGRIADECVLRERAAARCADVGAGTWHTVQCGASGSIVLETKAGPFSVVAPNDWPKLVGTEGLARTAVDTRSSAFHQIRRP